MTYRYRLTPVLLLLVITSVEARPKDYLKRPDAWFAGEEAERMGTNILSYQSELGGWPKNVETTAGPYSGDRKKLKPTYDNRATTDELRFLARLYNVTKNKTYRDAFDRGLNYVLEGQYDNGGWPQSTPPGTGYSRYITFNDDAMVRLLIFVREITSSKTYDFVDEDHRQAASIAFDRGIDCILKCQIQVDGKRTAWCAQHDEIDFHPQSARTYELATLSGAESVGVTSLLMSIENPSPEIINAVEASVAWYRKAMLTGIRVIDQKDDKGQNGVNKVVVNDPAAPPLWARFYDIQTNLPIFVDRDGIPKKALADIGYERRNGYVWYGNWPQKVLDDEYQEWKQQNTAKPKE